MLQRFRRHVPIVITALLTATLTAAGPSIAATVQKALFAEDADKVDGIHAVQFTGKAGQREKKLVATDGKGRLPNNIISKAPNSAKLNGLKSSRFVDHDDRTIVVDRKGKGDFKSIQAAIDSVPDTAFSTLYTILVLRGTYQERVTLKAGVDLVGVGEEKPEIDCACGAPANTIAGQSAALTLSGQSTVRNLFVTSNGGGNYVHGIDVLGNGNVVRDVDVEALNGSSETVGIYGSSAFFTLEGVAVDVRSNYSVRALRTIGGMVTARDSRFSAITFGSGSGPTAHGFSFSNGTHDFNDIEIWAEAENSTGQSMAIFQNGSEMGLRDSELQTSGGGTLFGIFNNGADAHLKNVSLSVCCGTNNQGVHSLGSGHDTTIERSTIGVSAPGSTVSNAGGGYTTYVATSRLSGPASAAGTSVLKCAYVYDESLNTFNGPACP